LELYDVDQVRTTPQVNQVLGTSQSKKTVFAIAGQVPDDVTFLNFENTDFDLLKPAIEECRVVKDEYEVALTRRANEVSTIAHTAVLKAVTSVSYRHSSCSAPLQMGPQTRHTAPFLPLEQAQLLCIISRTINPLTASLISLLMVVQITPAMPQIS
jgi:hypothetical protein